MKIFINGATGFVGRHVVFELLKRGFEVVAGVRDLSRAREKLGAEVQLLAMRSGSKEEQRLRLVSMLEGCDAIITLAGCSILKAATSSGFDACRRSRIGTSEEILEAVMDCRHPPKTWVATSAAGIYPPQSIGAVSDFHSGDDLEGESSRSNSEQSPDIGLESSNPVHGDPLSQLCIEWERVAKQAERFGVRVARMRLGAVLGREGQTWKQLSRPVLPKLGMVFGGGNHWFSWVHVNDVARIYAEAVEDVRFHGPVHVVAPQLITQKQAMRQINRTFGRIGSVSVPKVVIRWALGPAASVVADGAPIIPGFLQHIGYRFRFDSIRQVLSDLTTFDKIRFEPVRIENQNSEYLRRHSPKIAIRHQCEVVAPIDEVFAFFSCPENLGAMTPPNLGFAIQSPVPESLRENSQINYRIKLGKIPMNWSSEPEIWQPQQRFVDVQRKGPYSCWYHEHRFEPTQDGGTRVTDTVLYSLPLWSLSKAIDSSFVRKQLRYIFAYRGDVMRGRFGFMSERNLNNMKQDDSRSASIVA